MVKKTRKRNAEYVTALKSMKVMMMMMLLIAVKAEHVNNDDVAVVVVVAAFPFPKLTFAFYGDFYLFWMI